MGERVYAGLSAQERHDRRRDQLLEAGLDVFAEKGWAASTVADICRVASLSPRYFYELFPRREELFLAVTARIAADVEATVRAAVDDAGTAPRERAEHVLRALAGYFSADPRRVRVALMESLSTEEFRAQRRELITSFAALAARLMGALRDAPVRGKTQRRRLDLSAATLTGGIVEILIAHADTAAERPPPRVVDELVRHLTDLYVAAARL